MEKFIQNSWLAKKKKKKAFGDNLEQSEGNEAYGKQIILSTDPLPAKCVL